MNTRVPPGRTCAAAAVAAGFCSCDALPHEMSAAEYGQFQPALADAVRELNAVTGDGKLLCSRVAAADFEIKRVVKTHIDFRMEFRHLTGPLHVSATLNRSKRLMVGTTKFGQVMGMLTRLDPFSKECCLLDVDDFPPTFSKSIDGFEAVPGVKKPWSQVGYVTQHPRLYLRLCRCNDGQCEEPGNGGGISRANLPTPSANLSGRDRPNKK